MKVLKLKFVWMAIILASLAATLQACDDEPYYRYDGWIEGRTFAAYSLPGSYNTLWVATFFYDGQFQVSPCDENGYVIPCMEIYRGNYTVDYQTQRIFVSYYGYSMNSMWTYTWWDQYDPYTGTYPDMEIYTSKGFGALDNLVFTPY